MTQATETAAIIISVCMVLLTVLFVAFIFIYKGDAARDARLPCEAKGGVYIQSHCVRPM